MSFPVIPARSRGFILQSKYTTDICRSSAIRFIAPCSVWSCDVDLVFFFLVPLNWTIFIWLFADQMKSSELTTKWRNQTKYTKLFKSWLVIHNLNVVLLEGNGGSRIFTNYTVLQFKRFATKTQKRTANKQSEYRQEIAWNRKEIYGIP